MKYHPTKEYYTERMKEFVRLRDQENAMSFEEVRDMHKVFTEEFEPLETNFQVLTVQDVLRQAQKQTTPED